MIRMLALLMALALACTSCTALPAEERAFAVALCVGREGDTWRVHGRIPTYQTGGGYLTVSGEGASISDALSAMEATSPMQVTLSQLRLLVVEETLSRSADLTEVLHTLAERPDMHLQCALALTDQPAKDVAEALKPATGARLSKAIDVLLESRIEQGTILPARLSEVLRMGERQCPVLIDLTVKDKKISLSGGYALDGNMTLAKRLSEADTALLALLLQSTGTVRLSLEDGAAQVREVSVKTELVPDAASARVEVCLRITSAELTGEGLSHALAEECAALLTKLSRVGCDVLGLARQAIVHAEDMAQWHDVRWPERLRNLHWEVSVAAEEPV